MKNYFLTTIFIILFSIIGCKKGANKSINKDTPQNQITKKIVVNEEIKEGFLFINISKIYHNGGRLTVLKQDKESVIEIKDQSISINNKTFDIIDEEHLYRDSLRVESFDPEYSLFILESYPASKGFYEVKINNKTHLIDSEKYKDFLTFKTIEQYVLDAYPNPIEKKPLRLEPSEESKIVANFSKFTYISIEIKGDWLKIKDDEHCYPGEEPSKQDIIGWVRWRNKGVIILDIRHTW